MRTCLQSQLFALPSLGLELGLQFQALRSIADQAGIM